jgi:hypothetical protein
MALDKDKLAASLETLFISAERQSWDKAKVAGELAAAIDAFVKSADVVSVTVEVRSPANVVIGTGKQTSPGKVE